MNRLILAAACALAVSSAVAGVPNPVPEPGVLELLTIGGVLAAVIALRHRRGK